MGTPHRPCHSGGCSWLLSPGSISTLAATPGNHLGSYTSGNHTSSFCRDVPLWLLSRPWSLLSWRELCSRLTGTFLGLKCVSRSSSGWDGPRNPPSGTYCHCGIIIATQSELFQFFGECRPRKGHSLSKGLHARTVPDPEKRPPHPFKYWIRVRGRKGHSGRPRTGTNIYVNEMTNS